MEEKLDINFCNQNLRFNFRVAAFINYKQKILLSHTNGTEFWNMVGGRIKLGESTIEAIKRELNEELGLQNTKPKLTVVCENFFDWQGKYVQELVFIYRVKVDKNQFNRLENFIVKDSNGKETTKWFSKYEIKKIKCLPEIIYDLPFIPKNKVIHTIKK